MEEKLLHKKRMKLIKGRYIPVDITPRRIERRQAVYEITSRKDISWLIKTDMIIDYFQKLYEGDRYKGFTKNERRELFISAGGTCMWCKLPIPIGSFTIEHIVPLVEGGTDDMSNLGIAHAECNNGRDGDVITAQGYLIEALKKYNPRVRSLTKNGYPQNGKK